MKNKSNFMDEVRSKFPDLFPIIENDNFDNDDTEHYINNIYNREYYTYLLDQRTHIIRYINANVLKIHCIEKNPKVYDDIADLIHPDDIEFVKFAEIKGLETIKNLNNIEDFLVEFILRMKNSINGYNYFFHQSIHIRDSDKQKIKYTYRINRNLNNLMPKNKYTVTIRNHKTNEIINIYSYNVLANEGPKLSKRELEVLKFILEGFTDKEIAEEMFLSFNTVRTHRKNIIKKSGVNNSIELVNKYKDFMI